MRPILAFFCLLAAVQASALDVTVIANTNGTVRLPAALNDRISTGTSAAIALGASSGRWDSAWSTAVAVVGRTNIWNFGAVTATNVARWVGNDMMSHTNAVFSRLTVSALSWNYASVVVSADGSDIYHAVPGLTLVIDGNPQYSPGGWFVSDQTRYISPFGTIYGGNFIDGAL